MLCGCRLPGRCCGLRTRPRRVVTHAVHVGAVNERLRTGTAYAMRSLKLLSLTTVVLADQACPSLQNPNHARLISEVHRALWILHTTLPELPMPSPGSISTMDGNIRSRLYQLQTASLLLKFASCSLSPLNAAYNLALWSQIAIYSVHLLS